MEESRHSDRCPERNGIWICRYSMTNHPLRTIFTPYGVRVEYAHYMVRSLINV